MTSKKILSQKNYSLWCNQIALFFATKPWDETLVSTKQTRCDPLVQSAAPCLSTDQAQNTLLSRDSSHHYGNFWISLSRKFSFVVKTRNLLQYRWEIMPSLNSLLLAIDGEKRYYGRFLCYAVLLWRGSAGFKVLISQMFPPAFLVDGNRTRARRKRGSTSGFRFLLCEPSSA